MLPLSDDLEPVYPREATFGLLQTLRAGGLMNRGLPRGETADQAARKYGLAPAAADRCLTWLVKHGLACVKGWTE